MPITRTSMMDDDGSGTTGTILNNAWKQELYNQIDADRRPDRDPLQRGELYDRHGARRPGTVEAADQAIFQLCHRDWQTIVTVVCADVQSTSLSATAT